MARLVQFTLLAAVIWIASAVDASAATSISLPLPHSVVEVWSMLPAAVRTLEFWVGVVFGVIGGEVGRHVWRTTSSVCSAGMAWARYGLSYGAIAVAIFAVILFL